MAWKKGQLIWIEVDQSLGASRIVDDSDPQFFAVESLAEGERRNYTKRQPPFKRVQLYDGQKLKLQEIGDVTISRVTLQRDLYVFETELGSFTELDVQSLASSVGVADLLQQRQFSPPKLFQLRREAWQLLHRRHAHPLRGAVGCRVQLLEHQLWVLEETLQMPRVRALLADEVGLGKTIEAGLIFSALHAREKLGKVLILVPAALKVQWLTESFRRFNIRFRLDHEELIDQDEFRDFVIASLDEVEANVADFDLLIVDEAHRLVHDEHKSEALANLVARARHVLFLSATPRVHGDAEFLKLMQMLGTSPEGPVTPLLFQLRRDELGLPSRRRLEPVFVADKKAWLVSFLERKLAEATRDKVFVIASRRDEVVELHAELRRKLGENFALFHEGMDLVERDRQAAYFADPEGARFLLSSEIGGEGRNFQFCHDMVLWDLPRDPLVVEQRIGRLDRLGQTQDVKVWTPVLEESPEEEIFERLRDRFRVFEKPWTGSGLEDLQEAELVGAHDRETGLETLEKLGNFRKSHYDRDRARHLRASLEKLDRVSIADFLDRLYDLYGVEVEDFDSRGNWKISRSSLMFVDYFPGLGAQDERVVSFDRAQALAREDMSFFSLDHPEVVEALEMLLSSDHGKLCLAHLPAGTPNDVLFWGLVDANGAEAGVPTEKLWSASRRRDLAVSGEYLEPLEAAAVKRVDEAFFKALGPALQEFVGALGGRNLDALALLVPRS
jgi:ATP-dependent helicase HepA